MISVDGLTVEFGGTTLFSDISFQINEKDRIALSLPFISYLCRLFYKSNTFI